MNSMGVLCQRLSQQEFISVAEIVTAGSTFVKDHIPYLRFIIPEGKPWPVLYHFPYLVSISTFGSLCFA
jgi:hypothetical protein